ncbi:cysteine desulfurase IscS [Gammaproteobacteria bacterium]
MFKPIYLDYMATTPIDPRVAKKMLHYLTDDCSFGNSASEHFYGYQAKAVIEDARLQVATLINSNPKSIVWTSGATEANNLAIKGAACFYQRQGQHIITCKTEHKSVLDTCKYLETIGFSVTYLTPKPDGLIDLHMLEQALQSDTILVSLMHVNNEIGVIQDIAAISELTRSRGILFHVDATQSVGKIPIDLQKLKIDLMSFSAHKIYGPKGIGALYIRQQPKLHLVPQIHGGKQEHGLRSGTLASHQIVGMGEALQIAQQEMTDENQRLLALRKHLWQEIKKLGNVQFNGSLTNRIAGNLSVSVGGIDGELLVAALKDLALSTASTCTLGQPSYVLKAIGVQDELAQNTLRISIGRFTTGAEVDFAIKHIKAVVSKLRETQ